MSTLSGDLNEGSGGAFSIAVPSLFLCARWSDTTTTATDLVTRVVTTTGDCASGENFSEKKIGKRDSTDAVDLNKGAGGEYTLMWLHVETFGEVPEARG